MQNKGYYAIQGHSRSSIFRIIQRHHTTKYNRLVHKFYGTFNALYCRTKSSDSDLVCVELLKSFFLPMILYASEVTDPKKSDLAMLDSLINRAVFKILNSQKSLLFMISDISLYCMMLHLCVK